MEQKLSQDNESEGTSMAGSCCWTAEWRTHRAEADYHGRRPRCSRAAAADRRISPGEKVTVKVGSEGREMRQEWLRRQMGRWQQLGAAAAVEDSVGSDERLMEEKATGSRECSGRAGRRGSAMRGCYEWRRAMPEDVLRAEEEQQIWWKMAPMKVASGVSNNYIGGPVRRKGKSRQPTDQGKGPRDDSGVIDSIMSGAYLLLEKEIYTDEERVAFGAEEAEDVREGGDE
ncbi:hypothetical protein BHM03_00013469 [Ensete ventricosum]|nr:hypothetical protein BHM03_00013469 [Ensete ventricosum]